MSTLPWALILGASSGFGEATAIELARAGMNIFGVHLDRIENQPHVEELQQRIRALGRDCFFWNRNATVDYFRQEVMAEMRQMLPAPPGALRVLVHSLSWGIARPLTTFEGAATKEQIEMTVDTMGHSLVYWVRDCVDAGIFENGGRIFALTSSGSVRAIPNYGPVGAAKAALEAYIRQLALELAPMGITANAISAGVCETAALKMIPGHERLIEEARRRNPHHRLTAPEDVARCIAALCHPATYWLTGNVLHVDGGEFIVG
jgi:enoyl-[acyl-carrier protein] reductase III